MVPAIIFMMRIFLPLLVALTAFDVAAQDSFNVDSLWHTSITQSYDEKKSLGQQEANDIVKSPVFMELEANKQEFRTKRFEISTGVKMTQLKQNTAAAVLIGKSNMFPVIQVKGTIWALSWFGFDASLDKGILVMLGSKEDPNVPNSTLISPYWMDLGIRMRYLFDKRDGSSFMALKIGYHQHSFPITTYPQYISKDYAKGVVVGAQRRLAFNQYFGLDMSFDFMFLSKLLDKSIIPNAQKGIGYRFNADLCATIVDRTGLTTLVSFGYGQTSYIANLAGEGVSGDSRSILDANHFEQTYSDLHLTFTARI